MTFDIKKYLAENKVTTYSRIDESPAGEEAKKRGLQSIGFGRYVDPSDPQTVVAKSVKGKLVAVNPQDDAAPGERTPGTTNQPQISPEKSQRNPIGSVPRSEDDVTDWGSLNRQQKKDLKKNFSPEGAHPEFLKIQAAAQQYSDRGVATTILRSYDKNAQFTKSGEMYDLYVAKRRPPMTRQ